MIYEVRTYTLRTGTVPEFEERYAKRLPARLKHSQLGAFWHTEFGPLNQVVHVYPYDDLQHRTRVRAALAQDPERNALPGGQDLIVAQEAEIMIPAPFMATADRIPCRMRSTRMGLNPTLTTCAPIPTMTGRPLRWAFATALATARNVFTPRIPGSER